MMKKFILYYIGVFLCSLALSAHDFNFCIKGLDLAETKTTAFLYAHGLASTWVQGIEILWRHGILGRPRWIMDGPLAVFDFPDAKKEREYHNKEVNLAQEKDIDRLHAAYERMCQLLPSHDIVLAGISRGASAILNFAAVKQPKNIRALIAESPFDTLSSVIKHMLIRFHVSWVPFSKHIGHKVCRKIFPGVNPKGMFPLNVVEKIPQDMPIMLVHSKKDRTVPINSSRRLYIKLRETGHEHVYLVELQSGNHGKLIFGPDADFYTYVAHAFYKRYNIDHHPDFAHHGKHLLALCQPSIADVSQRIQKKRQIDDEEDYELELVDDE
ncbi:MAG: alpha/beta hydrolase family protein [Candidatus Babeliales bacterium]